MRGSPGDGVDGWERTLDALGLATVPALEPLSYPGLPVPEASLLVDRVLLRLRPGSGPLDTWQAMTRQGPVALGALLDARRVPETARRVPVLSVGSNASPAQLSNKLLSRGLSGIVPMVPVLTSGIAVGLCANIYPAGYVAAAPYLDKGAELTLAVTWLDEDQLAAVDATELPSYERVLLPGSQFALRMPGGHRLESVHLYASARGLLSGPGGVPRPAPPDQTTLLTQLLAGSQRLREMFGPGPRDWVARAARDAALCERGTRVFRDEGWVVDIDDFAPYALPRPNAG